MKPVIFILLFVFTAFSVFSMGKKEKTNDSSAEKTITGKIRIYGNEPHTFVGIIDEKGTEYAVYSPSQEGELRKLQGHLIEFVVIFLDEPKGFGRLQGGTVTPVRWKVIQ